MAENLDTLEQIRDALESFGYQTKLHAEDLSINVGQHVVATAIVDQDKNELVLTCLLSYLSDIIGTDADEGQAAAFFLELLDAKSLTRPCAFSVEPGGDSADEFPLVLEDSVALGDFSEGELKVLMENLNKALAIGHNIITAARASAVLAVQG